MRLLVLGGTHFLGRHVVDAAGAGGLGARARRRHLPPVGGPPCPQHSHARAGALHGGRQPQRLPRLPPGPVGREDDEATWDTADDDYGPNKADAERVIGRAVGGGFLTARAGLIVGPYDDVHRLGCRRT